MTRPVPGDAISEALHRLIEDAKNPSKYALIGRLQKHALTYALEDGQLYRDLMDAIEMLGGHRA
jgi:hypothetical protein